MFKNAQRMHILSNNVILGFDGEYSDFMYIVEELEKMLYGQLRFSHCIARSRSSWRTIPRSPLLRRSTSFVPGSIICVQKWNPCGTQSLSSDWRARSRRCCEIS